MERAIQHFSPPPANANWWTDTMDLEGDLGCDSTGHAFTWQEGYGAFTVGISQKAHTIAYIASQAQHHAKHSFEEEFIVFLKKHGIEYDPQSVYG